MTKGTQPVKEIVSKTTRLVKFLLGCCFVFGSTASVMVSADPWASPNKIILSGHKGERFEIGTVSFTRSVDDVYHYELDIDHAVFKDFFLSMKEMKCLEGVAEVFCHIPYPYANPHTVTEEDFRWLSHDLLFMYKKPREFGARLWNGIYYDFKVEGDTLVGVAQAVDLNLLAAPPEDQSVPPLTDDDRYEITAEDRWLPFLKAEPVN